MAIRTEDKMIKLISVVGTATTDISYYFARTLNAAGLTCLVVDNSREKRLFHSIPKAEGEFMVQTGNIFYIAQTAYSEGFFSQYDFVLINHGLSINKELLEASDYVYLITDYSQYSTQNLKVCLSNQKGSSNYYLICKDKVVEKISPRHLIEEMNLAESQIMEIYELYLNEQDATGLFNLYRSGQVQMKTLSSEMKELLRSFLYVVIEKKKTKREHKAIFRELMTGKIR